MRYMILDKKEVYFMIKDWTMEKNHDTKQIKALEQVVEDAPNMSPELFELEYYFWITNIKRLKNYMNQYRQYLANSLNDERELSEASLSQEELTALQSIVQEATEKYNRINALKKKLDDCLRRNQVSSTSSPRVVGKDDLIKKLSYK